jgi:hypothetical protein
MADALNIKVHELHATAISIYMNDIQDRVMEVANVDLQYKELVAKLHQRERPQKRKVTPQKLMDYFCIKPECTYLISMN